MAENDLVYQASDPFGIGDDTTIAIATGSESSSNQYAPSLNSIGNVMCESGPFDVRTDASAEYQLCGGSAPTLSLGEVKNGYVITGITVNYSNTEQPTMTVEGHLHDGASHVAPRKLAVTIVTNGGGVGVPTIPNHALGTNEANSASMAWTLEHMDNLDSNGNWFDGENRAGLLTVSIDGVGSTTGIVVSAPAYADNQDEDTSNQESNTFSITTHEHLALA